MIYSIGDTVDCTRLLWESDWNGDEVGHDDCLVIGLYSDHRNEGVSYYIDMETSKIVEVLIEGEEDLL